MAEEVSQEITDLADKALSAMEKIEALSEEHILEHAQELAAVRVKLQRLMSDAQLPKVELDKGTASWVQSSSKSLDKVAIAKDLGISDLSQYETVKPSESLRMKLKSN